MTLGRTALKLCLLILFALSALACSISNTAVPATVVIEIPASNTSPSSTRISPTSSLIASNTATLSTNTLTPTITVILSTQPFSATSTATFTNVTQPTAIPPTATVPPPSATTTPTNTSPLLPTATQSPASTNTLPAPTATQAPATGCQPDGNSSLEGQLIALINAERNARGIALLSAQGQLTAAARGHSADMACNNFFSHTGSNGSGLGQRLAAQSYGFSAAAENIGAGYSAAQAMFDGWMSSEGHRENMLNPAYSEVGIGYSFRSNTEYGHYWVADFGSP